MTLAVTVTTTELDREVGRAQTLTAEAERRGKARVRFVSLKVLRGIKERTPIDTGRARNSWGADIWTETDNGWTIIQGSRVVYFQRLNEGWSKQAPAGFVDTEAEKGLDDLMEGLLQDFGEALG